MSAPIDHESEAREMMKTLFKWPMIQNYQGYYCILYKKLSMIHLYCGEGKPPEIREGRIDYMEIDESDERIYLPRFDEKEQFLGFENSRGISVLSKLESIINSVTPQHVEEFSNSLRLRGPFKDIKIVDGSLMFPCEKRGKDIKLHSGMFPPIHFEIIYNFIRKKNENKYEEIQLNCNRVDFERYYTQWVDGVFEISSCEIIPDEFRDI
jgi:hypothetical protein